MTAPPGAHADQPRAPTRKVTFCRICEASCGLLAEVEGERVLRLLPDPDHVVSKGFVCVKGVRYTELHHSPDRVTTPLKRVGDRFEPITWQQALSEIGAKVKALRAAHGDDSIGMYIGNPSAFSVPHILLASMFIEALGTPHLYTPGSQDCNNKFVVSEELYGSPMLQPIPDVDAAECVIMVGTNPAVSQLTFANTPRLMERLKAVEKAGGSVTFVNPRRTESAQQVGAQLFIRPGSDVFFFLAFAHLVLAARPALPVHLHDKVVGLDAVRALVAPWTPERVADVTGIAPEALRALVQRYLAADGAVLYAGTGVNQGQHGTLCAWLLNVITLASGNLDRAGGMLVTPQGVRAAKLGVHGKKLAEVRTFSRIGGHRSVMGSWPAGILADEILTPGKGQLRAMFVTAGNPLLSLANSERVSAAMAQLELLVCVDLFRNETGNLAHYVLPATSMLERVDVPMGMGGYQPVPYAQMVEPVVPARGEARDEWWIFAQLARACGARIMGSKALTAWMSLDDASKLPRALRFRPELLYTILAGFEKLTLGKLRKNPHGVLLPAYRGGKFFGRGVLTADKKVHAAPQAFLEAARALDGAHEAMLASLAQPSGALRLITKREKTSHNSWMHNVESFVSGPRGTNHLFMHPHDAQARGLRNGDPCEVRTPTGAVHVPVKLTDELMPGTVALPHGWGHQRADGLRVASRTRGMNANVLAPDGSASLEKLAGMTHLTALEVQVTKVSEAALPAAPPPRG